MILVVADTGPICYLALIEATDILSRLYDRVVLPSAVLAELTHPNAPSAVKAWASRLPAWVEVRRAIQVDAGSVLGPGEAEAIALAQELNADSLLLDETEARQEALRLGLPVSGTIGVLEKAAERDLVNLPEMFSRLSRTSFHISRELLTQALNRDAERRARKERERGMER
jgi:predicted nucleic acid-binding protein